MCPSFRSVVKKTNKKNNCHVAKLHRFFLGEEAYSPASVNLPAGDLSDHVMKDDSNRDIVATLAETLLHTMLQM